MGVNRNILNLAVPSILANITVPLVGMADIAVAGHLDAGNAVSSATLIGGVAIGTMLFDLLNWNFGFLRVGTGGLTAQAFGRGDRKDSASILTRAAGIAVACSLLLLAVQWIFLKAAFAVVDCTPEVEKLASDYFFISDVVYLPERYLSTNTEENAIKYQITLDNYVYPASIADNTTGTLDYNIKRNYAYTTIGTYAPETTVTLNWQVKPYDNVKVDVPTFE